MQASGGGDTGGGSHAAGTYRSLRSNRPSHAIGEINVTPLVDVVLVLLLVFMVTAPMMSRGIDVSLPVANQPQVDKGDRVQVSINAQGQIFLMDKPVNAVLLEDRLRALMDGRPAKVVYLRADESLRYGKVIAVVDKIKNAGVDQIGFAYVLPAEKAAESR
jgi:biopolymer transport protein ExbD